MTACGGEFRRLGDGASSFGEVAHRVVDHLLEALRDEQTGERQTVLLRFFRTRPYGALEPERKAFADRVLAGSEAQPDAACLVLEATAGIEASWCSVEASKGHRVIPLVTPQMVERSPMISRLFEQLGADVASVVRLGPTILMDPAQTNFGVFFVPIALGSEHVPVQEEFVIPYGVRSVVGFGGQLPSGSVFALILFAGVEIPRESADAFQTLALSVKLAVLPFDAEPSTHHELATVQQLVDVYERTAVERDEQLRGTLAELRRLNAVLGRRVEEGTRELADAAESLVGEVEAHKLSVLALHAERERLSVTLRSIGDAVIVADASGVVSLLNPVAEALTGWPEARAVGRPVTEVFQIVNERTRAPVESPVARVLQDGAIVGLANHTVLIALGGTERAIADSGAPIRDHEGRVLGVILVFRDVSAARHIERELQQVSQLRALGVLAGGIAHDFNNYLAVVLGNLDLARMRVGEAPKVVEALSLAHQGCMRARDLTQKLLSFAKGGAPIRQPCSVAELCGQVATLMLAGTDVDCEVLLPRDLPPVEVDPGQIQQVLQNLLLNAREAMPSGGKVRILVEEPDPSPAAPPGTGEFVSIVVEDEGIGIPEEVLAKIFEPFFTTKATGGGLGLTTTYGIVRAHGGTMGVQSTVGVGTRVWLRLPVATREVPVPEATPAPKASTGGLRILVMDDQEPIRRVLAMLLGELGHEVTATRDGEEAIARVVTALQRDARFDLAILDLTVPGGMGGREALPRIRALDRGIRVACTSGYSEDSTMGRYREIGFDASLPKPYTTHDILALLARLAP